MAEPEGEEQLHILEAEDIGTLEDLVFSDDRLKYVNENFGKTDEAYWFYRLLTLQNRFGSSLDQKSKALASCLDKMKKVDEVKDSAIINELQLRQSMINFEKSTAPIKKQTMTKLKNLIQPNLPLEQDLDTSTGGKKTKGAATSLTLDTKTLLNKKFSAFSKAKRSDLSSVFTACAATFLANQKLNAEMVGDFLDLVENEAPEIPFILPHVRKDLKENNIDFGDRTIHYRLTKENLQLLEKTPSCASSENYMKCYAWKLRKVTDVSYVFDDKARDSYLEELKNFADSKLSKTSKFNPLRALILYNWLIFKEKKNIYDKRVLKTYMKIPRDARYSRQIFANTDQKDFAGMDYVVDLIPELNAIGDDEHYVRRALTYVFESSDDTTAKWKDVVDLDYLRKLYCEVKLSKGQGKTADLRRAYGKFGKYAFQDLVKKVNIELKKSNLTYFSVADTVSLTFFVKNVPEMECRIYQVDCKEYFLRFKKRISLDIPLDGLAPNYVIKKTFKDPPLLQRARTIELSQLKGKRGVFLIELFGNGHKCRALVRKGELRYVSTQGVEIESGGLGYCFTIFSEQNQQVKNGEIYMDGVRYTTNENGVVFVPFSASPNEACPMIMEDLDNPGSATINFFNYKTENYRLECGMFIDRESLLEKQPAKIIIRPTLILNDVPVSVTNLKKCTIKITSTDAQDRQMVKVLSVEMQDDAESVIDYIVPTKLRKLELQLNCEVYSSSQEKLLQLQKEESFTINDIDSTNALADMHLIPMGSKGYTLAVLGKNGEPYRDIIVDLELSHRFFQEKLKYTLRTDEQGQIALGRLPDIRIIEATPRSDVVYQSGDEEIKHEWILLYDQVNVPTIVNVKKGDEVKIPFMIGGEKDPKVDVYDIDFVRKFPNVSYKNGYIIIKNLPGGIFQAFIRDKQDAEVLIHVSKGETFGSHVVTNNRICELSEDQPLQITDVKGDRFDGYQIQVAGHNERTRIHIFSSHLVPRFSSYLYLASPEIPLSVLDTQAYPAVYGDMEQVSEEYQYIDNRKGVNKFSGNMLQRPSMLSQKWTTSAPVKQRRPPMQTEFEDESIFLNQTEKVHNKLRDYTSQMKVQFDSSNLEFLKESSVVMFNLKPNADGTITVPAKQIKSHQNLLQIIAVDDDNTCLRNVILQDVEHEGYKDVTLQNPLDPDTHWTELREILELSEKGDTLVIPNFATSEIETYDDISDVYELYYVLSGNNKDLECFKFLLLWKDLSMEEKLQRYDEFACNEVNFFVFRKDPDFFKQVIQPVLASKVQKGFLDLYMLGQDVSSYTGTTKYQSLNTLERVLLASKVKELVEPTLKFLKDSVAGIPSLPQESDTLFDAALEAKQVSATQAHVLVDAKGAGFLEQNKAVGHVIDQTREYTETRYYKVPFVKQTSDLVPASRFWLDYATFLLTQDGGNFLSKEFHTPATGNLTQMLLGLSVLDLPFRSGVEDAVYKHNSDGSAVLTVSTATLVLSRQIKQSEVQTSALSVSTNYFDPTDRTEVVDFEKQDRFLKMPLQTHKVYGCRVVITNVSSMSHTVEMLSQIPQGSIPVNDGFRTNNMVSQIEPYTTWHSEFYFYFPNVGEFMHFQTRVSKNGKVIGFGKEDPNIVVVGPETVVDTTSWEYFSNVADSEALLDFLKTSPQVHVVDLSKIAWRMKDESLFVNVTSILRERQIYIEQIWAYSLVHYSVDEVKEYLSMQEKVLELISPHLDSSVLTDYDAFDRQSFQVMEYWPLTCARAHKHTFDNENFQKQYRSFLKCALYKSYHVESMTPVDKMTGVYYFLIQNRIKDAQQLFSYIDEKKARDLSAFTFDYLRAYMAFYSGEVSQITQAQSLIDEYSNMTLPPSKAAMWQGVRDYLDEIKDSDFASEMFDPTTEADILSARSRKLDCEVNSNSTITISYSNIDNVEVNFYKTDIELQFSVSPFRQEHNAFNFVTPTDSMNLDLDKTVKSLTFDLPPTLQDCSSVVEVIGGGLTVSKPNYDNSIRVEISAQLRQIRVFDKVTNQAVSRAYVKVYGQTPDSPDGRFIKDGYTDLRGRFDYSTVSSDEMSFVKSLAILILTPSAGADVIEIDI